MDNHHQALYKQICQLERYTWLDLPPSYISNLKKQLRDRKKRESLIPQNDVKEAILQMIDHPSLGGRKGALKLVEDEKALIGETVYKTIKNSVKWLSELEHSKRKEQSELEKNKYARRPKEERFQSVISNYTHEVWAIDYVYISLFGIIFYICLTYDLYSQSHLSIEAGLEPSTELAIRNAGEKPKCFILSDNGKQFLCDDYLRLLEENEIDDKQIPPGKPWYNGSLESCNRDLKKVIYTHAAYEACENTEITRLGMTREDILWFLQRCCEKAWHTQNILIPRTKFKTTPGIVVMGWQEEKRIEKDRFKRKKLEERKKIMKQMKEGKTKNMNLADKVKAAWDSTVKNLSNEKLYAFTELINGRFSFVMR